ncbi:uncharacterized protein LOC142236845 [Haematobia irritans]|uniref:uncharacterized protein LOC142236845 n=1 Tax=Haematobia irritans TaxID=7368 RepID=UPI003F4FDC66
MDNKDLIVVKVEDELNAISGDESFDEYVVMERDYKQEEEQHYTHEFSHDPDCSTTSSGLNETQQSLDDKKYKAKYSTHTRKAIVNHFLKHGWTSKSYVDLCKKIPEEYVKRYENHIRQTIAGSQQYVYQECESLCFENISAWLNFFKEMNVPANSYYESAIVVNSIVKTDKFPKPDDLGGVNLKAVYSFICNALQGLPQSPLDRISAKFLAKEFETLIDEANTENGDAHTLQMREKLIETLPRIRNTIPNSLDPLWITENTVVQEYTFPIDYIAKTSANISQKKKQKRKLKKDKKALAETTCNEECTKKAKKDGTTSDYVDDINFKNEPPTS